MAKHHDKKPHAQGAGIALTGSFDELISLLITNNEDKEWAINEVANEGPAHKQVFSALLLTRMYKLVQQIEKQTGSTFSAQKGVDIISAKEGYTLPVQLPSTVIEKENLEAVAEAVSHSPSHELVAFTTLLQAIEWSIKSTKNKTV